MRFQRLELVRYGGFADRVFDFGEGGEPDLHLVVGPNEAGKSTALQAIGDLLFGIPGQTGQGWRYDYNQLRLRALIEHDGTLLDVMRRKGNRDTLLTPDGTPYAHDPLAPLLGGVDRAAFERMFGLDHAKLRHGGESILSGRDDAARITLEAGTGVSHIGSELARLTDDAAALFKPSGQNPIVNRLMRERSDALASVRQSAIGDSEWAQVRQRRTKAQEDRVRLIDEAATLDREQARLDRIGRARAPLARLGSARGDLAALGATPDLPLNAAEQLTNARAERATAGALAAQARADLQRVEMARAEVAAPGPVLASRTTIEDLDERRPVIAQAAIDLVRRKAELARIDARIAAARAEARIAADAMLPTAGWRRRASLHLEARRDARLREQAAAKEHAKAQRARDVARHALSDLGETADVETLTRALGLLPVDAEDRWAEASAEAGRRRARATELLADLAPWQGTPETLRSLDMPSAADAAEARRVLDGARADAVAARKEAEAAQANAIRARAKLAGLAAGGPLPTAEAVAAMRRSRDELVDQVGVCLADDHRSGDGEIARALAAAVRDADLIADRRDAEATRVAEHTLTVVTLQEAETLGDHATQREANHLDTAKQSEEAWSARLHALGFAHVILPADFAGWLTRRGAALEADAERAVAEQAGDALRERIDDARKQIAEALADAGVVVPDDAQLVVHARERETALTTVAGDRTRLCGDIEAADATMAEMEIDAADRTRTRTTLDVDLHRLAHEAGLPEHANEAMLIDAVEAFAQIADEIGSRDGLARQIDGIERDRLAFESDLDGLVAELGAAREGPAIDQVRLLAAELRDAVRREGELAGHAAEVSRLTGELERVERRLTTAQTTLDKLVSTAGVENDAALDKVVADHALRAGLLVAERDALGELAGLDNGVGMDLLANEVAALSAEDEAAARSSIEERRRDVATEREEVGRALNAAEDEAARAATESVAADAQQVATETTAALAQAAEEHVETAAAAALLRWMLDRHRATNQAPLIARAGALFARVTGGAFSGLTVGYGDNDRPVILATRSDGAEVGVEGLSEGTRDQLFLALRLGSIEGRATGGALPVICDDLLITADDERAGALLTVLAAAAAHTQVIVFSHHHHLVEVAGRAIGTDGFRLHRIEPAALATAA